MKRWIACILVLISSRAFACSYYPYGEEMRFTLFNPYVFGIEGFNAFYYTAHDFSDPPDDTSVFVSGERENIALWRARCHNIPSFDAVYEAVYKDFVFSDNAFLAYLTAHRDTEAIAYLRFARASSSLSDLSEDPWERNQYAMSILRAGRTDDALQKAGETKDRDIALRYAFLAIRLAYYNGDAGMVTSVYAEYFEGKPRKTIIDYWALHFRTLVEKRPSWRNYYAALVFAHAPDKRFAVFSSYERSVPIAQVLAHAKNNEERAAIWFLEGMHRAGRALECMQRVNELQPKSEWVDFLLLREVNKIEDWVLTPDYTMEQPSVLTVEQQEHYSFARNVPADRAYAQQVLEFALQKKTQKRNRVLWKLASAHLAFMTRNYAIALRQLERLPVECKSDSAWSAQAELIRSLCLVAAQDTGSAIIPASVKPVLMAHFRFHDQRFVLAVAKELERLGNTTDAALLLSKLDADGGEEEQAAMLHTHDWDWWGEWAFGVNYFFYLDEHYSPKQVTALIDDVTKNAATDSFSVWKYSVAKHDLPKLYDLLGTKYIRLDKLKEALHAFEKVDDTLWTSESEPYAHYLNANPFYANMYSEHQPQDADSVHYDKESITRTLLQYLQRANNPNNVHRGYYYFLVANCYWNMTNYGNSWMMRRYWWSGYSHWEGFADDVDYYHCARAKYYYLQAMKYSRDDHFAALCLRMTGKCESHRLAFDRDQLPYELYDKVKPKSNRYYLQLQKNYPGYYDELMSDCYSFDEYFKTGNR